MPSHTSLGQVLLIATINTHTKHDVLKLANHILLESTGISQHIVLTPRFREMVTLNIFVNSVEG